MYFYLIRGYKSTHFMRVCNNEQCSFCRSAFDTTTGMNSDECRRKVLSELPFLLMSAHDTYTNIGVTELLSGSEYDGSAFIQGLFNIPVDSDWMICRTYPLTQDEQKRIVRYIPRSSIYCRLD